MLKENCTKHEPLSGLPLTAESLFSDSPPGAKQKFAEIKRTKCFPKEVSIYQMDDIPQGVYILREGTARLSCNTVSGVKKIIRLIEPDEIIGLTETLAGVPCQTNAETLTSCVFEYIEGKDLLNFLREEPSTCLRLVQILADNLQKSYRTYAGL